MHDPPNRILTALVLCLLLAACREDPPPPEEPLPAPLTDSLVHELTWTFGAAVSDSIGEVRRARFLADGLRIAVLDKFPPFLHLYTSSGRFLWGGVGKGGGPSELTQPTSLATKGGTVVVTQPGALKTWVLEGDSLRFLRTQPLPLTFVPLDAEFLCGDRLLLYGRENSQFLLNPHDPYSHPPELDWLFFLEDSVEGLPALVPRWSEPRDPSAPGSTVLNSTHLSSTPRGGVLLHRTNPGAPGRILEFDCDLGLLRARQEADLIHGDSIPALDPRKFALGWSSGVLALPDGLVAAPIHRPTSPRRATSIFLKDTYTRTEVFWFENGQFLGSVLIARMWRPQDYDPEMGAILSTHEPFPHFIVVPPGTFRPPQGEG